VASGAVEFTMREDQLHHARKEYFNQQGSINELFDDEVNSESVSAEKSRFSDMKN